MLEKTRGAKLVEAVMEISNSPGEAGIVVQLWLLKRVADLKLCTLTRVADLKCRILLGFSSDHHRRALLGESCRAWCQERGDFTCMTWCP